MNDVSQIFVDINCTIKDALEVLNNTGKRVLILVDQKGTFQRTITDGDIRRLLIKDITLENTLQLLEPQQSIVINSRLDSNDILAIMIKNEVAEIPLIDNNNKPIDIYFRAELQPHIFLSMPHMSGNELEYVEQAFDTNWIAPVGPNVDGFENEFSKYIETPYSVALSCGTAAIHLALRLLNIKSGDIVLCSSFTFVASANPILYERATPVFIDSEPKTWNMSPLALEEALKKYSNIGKKPKAIIVAHLYGQSADMNKIMHLSELYDVPVIEDAAESLGALCSGKKTGTYGKFGVFSFNGNKIITTSGGGMLISENKDLIEKAKFLSTQAKDDAPYYEHSEIGFNYRMSNVLAGIGRGQLKILDQRVRERRNIFKFYRDNLEYDFLDWMPEPKGDFSSRWLSAVSLNPKKIQITPSFLIKEILKRANIELRHVWKPLHSQPLFKGADYFPHSEESFCDFIFQTSVCLPSTSSMDDEQKKYVVSNLKKILT
jgi:dTDP-4-amino-4,6-dideoxygalactose transaminase